MMTGRWLPQDFSSVGDKINTQNEQEKKGVSRLFLQHHQYHQFM